MKNGFSKMQGVIVGLTGCVLVLSFYLQYVEDIIPCPLCLMQRGLMGLIFLCALIGIFIARKLILGLEFFCVLGGSFFAVRQLWLQSLPPADTGMCLPGIHVLMEKLPWHEVLQVFVWGGKTSCAEVSWTLFGFSMAAWSLFYFCLIGILGVFLGVNYFRDEHV